MSERIERDAGATSTAPDPAKFREVLGHYPTGVVVVTAIAADGAPAGMVIGSFTSVSLEPQVVAYLPSKSSQSFARLREAETFCVNVLGLANRNVAEHFMVSGANRFDVGEWHEEHGVPVLATAQSSFVCRRAHCHEFGTHSIFIGELIAAKHRADAAPLTYYDRHYIDISEAPERPAA